MDIELRGVCHEPLKRWDLRSPVNSSWGYPLSDCKIMQLVPAPVWIGVFAFSQIKGSILVALVFLSEATPVVNSLTNLRAIILLSKQYYYSL